MKEQRLMDTVYGALGIALVFCATYFIKVPNGFQGYFNLGDGFILLFSSFLNPLAAFLLGGVGSCLADAIGGYGIYVIPTLLIKGIEAVAVSLWMRHIHKEAWRMFPYLLGSIIMLVGYFLADTVIHDSWQLGAAAILTNLLQAVVGIIIAWLAYPLMKRNLKMIQKNPSER